MSLLDLSRLYLCWVPALLITWRVILGMKEISIVPVSSYDGLRIYLLATSCIPYLLLDRKNIPLLIVGILPNLLLLLFCDPVLDLAGVGYSTKGVQDTSYAFTQSRSLIAYLVIGGSCLSLKLIVDASDTLNQKLISELEEKNVIIKRHAESEKAELNQQLTVNEQNYRSLFEQASDAIMVTDLNGNFIDVNSAMCKMVGYTKEELLSLNIADVIDPDQLSERPIRFDKLSAGEHVFSERKMLRKDQSEFFIEANVKKFGENRIMAIARDISNRKVIEEEKEKVRYILNERVKELTTLYKCHQILEAEKKPVHEALQEIVSVLPDGWQYPTTAAARISLAGMEFVTPNFGPYKHRQFSEFTTRNQLHGTIEVVYLEDRPTEAEGPFLAEERNLINMIAEMIRIYLSRRYEAEALKRTEANQSATINNTGFFIWSVNREYEIISFNKPFAEFSKSAFGLDVKIGTRLTDESPQLAELRNRWVARYNRALAGETFKVKSEIDDAHFEYSLNPIIEEGRIIGVSVFGEDISERLKHEKDMLAVNKQLGELRLMSLRSVMNPHFIFNCLNSIQYYIMENDQKNAVTYLSTFSKLIRAILNNSVHNKVKLAEELDTLKLYIQLESLRFENKFDSVIHVDPELDIESIEIPSMLIQPYAENAILHGLYNKPEKGLLKISVSAQHGMILVEVEDNGVGRVAASTVKQLNLPRHKSMGTALTAERLKLINAEGNTSVEIIDLETDGKPAGTLVKVWIKE
jgi:PAS domain S-box-containing protein